MTRLSLLLLLLAASPLAAQDLYKDQSKLLEARTEDLLGRLTPEEKLLAGDSSRNLPLNAPLSL